MKNIAIIIQKLNGGGAERTAANLSNILSENYNVHLIVYDGEYISYPYSGTLHDLHAGASKNYFTKLCNFIIRIKGAKKIKKQEKIDVTISLLEEANLVNVLSKADDKIITSIRNNMSQEYKSPVKRLFRKVLLRFVSKKSNWLVALSHNVEEDLVKNFGADPNNTITIYNPCDAEKLRLVASKKDSSDKIEISENSVSTMGRLSEQKGQWHLIRAFKKIVKKIPDAKLYILGTGELEKRLKKLVEELGLNNNIVFVGYVDGPHSIIEKTKVFAFSSLYEGLGNVLLEAMAFGVPCISSDCFSGPREILAPGTKIKHDLERPEFCKYGVLVSAGNNDHFNAEDPLTNSETQLAEAIITMLKDTDLRNKYSQKAEERSTDFLPQKIYQDWLKIIEN